MALQEFAVARDIERWSIRHDETAGHDDKTLAAIQSGKNFL